MKAALEYLNLIPGELWIGVMFSWDHTPNPRLFTQILNNQVWSARAA